MAFTKYIVPALSVAASAYAQSCGSDTTATITAAAAASSIAACSTYDGAIAMASGAAAGGVLDLGELQEITGDFTYSEDDTVKTITANSLEKVGNMNLTNLAQLSSLAMQRLTEVGDLTLVGLGGLNSFNFGNPGVGKAGKITIINTQIEQLNGINQAEEIDSLVVSDNKFLSEIGLNISKVGAIDIGPNNVAKGQRAMFPKLGTARFLNFRNCTEVDVSTLGNVSTLFGLYGNYFESFSAPELVWAGGVVADDNAQLTNLSFPALERINNTDNGTLQIANNTKLATVDGFAKLESVTGDVDISGNVDEIALDSLKTVSGAFKVDTSSEELDCGPINDLKDDQVVRGKLTCETGDKTPTSGNGHGTSDTGDGSSESSSIAIPKELPSFLTTGAFAGLLALLM